MAGFTKLCSSIITSSVWSEDDKTRIMWVTMLAVTEADGYVAGSVPGMASVARMTVDDARKSINKLCSPDPDSRTADHEGRRIIPCDGGWMIVNYLKYRATRDPEERRKYMTEYMRKYRTKTDVNSVNPSKPQLAQAEAEAEADKNKYIVPNGTTGADKPSTPEEKNFELARVAWPGKKRGFRTEFKNFCKHHEDWRDLLDDDGLAGCVRTLIERKAYSPGFWPMFQTWCNQSRYEEALQPPEARK